MRFTRTYFSKNLTLVLVTGTAIIIVITLFIAIKVYRIAAQETKTSQGVQQLEMARAAALGIQYFLNHLSDDLHSFAFFPGMQYFEPEPLRANVNHFYRHANQKSLKAIFVVDQNARLAYSTEDSLPTWLSPLLRERIKASLTGDQQDRVWFSQVVQYEPGNSDSELCLVMLAPLVQESKDNLDPNTSNQVVGMVGYLVSFDWLMQQFIIPIQVGDTGFAWVMDQHGRLLFHPRHPEMMLRSIYSREVRCRQCHESFEKQEAMIHNRFEYQEYQVGNEPAKILAQAPMMVSNEKWIIAVSIDLAEVTAIMRKNFRLFFWLVGLALTSIIVGGMLLMFVNIRRVQAEANSRHSEEKRLLQEQIHQAAKLASIGELVDSVAHEINTPIGIVSAQVDAMLLRAKNLPYADVLDIIKDQTRRIGNYTKSLLRFSRRMKFQPEPTDLIDMTEECLTLLGHQFRANKIEIKRNWPTNLPPVIIDRNQMQQVLLNLLNNAVDALKGKGEICIAIHPTNGDNGLSGVKIMVADTGPGIRSEYLSKIFDPFFSTKPPDKGTGLGLAISRAIVQHHGGWIRADSEEGKGACFTVFIPYQKS
ncbi:MAG: ATP-binding protein [bacterium]